MALRRPAARHTRTTADPEFGQNDLDVFEKQERQRKARARKSAVGQPVPAATENHQHSPDTTTTKPERAGSVAEDQLQYSLDTDSIDPPTTIPDADPELVIGRLPRRSLSAQSTSSNEETLSAYYKRTGYLAPLSESTLEVIRQVLADPSMGSTAGRLVSEADQQDGLASRNVNWDSTPDPFRGTMSFLQAQAFSVNGTDEKKKWDDDLKKCRADPQEFVFQRTVMMSMVNRHRLIYGDNGVLDFAVERAWTCLPMPTKALRESDGKHLPQPKPDIAIAFRTDALMDNGTLQNLPGPLRNVICYEGKARAHKRRAFHFFIIESKNKYRTILDPGSQYQVLNSASQSLHNMYEFFNEAGPKHLAKFFDEVRVFSAVSTSEGIIIRIHRACLARNFRGKDTSHQEFPAPQFPILPDYPLQFEYDICFQATANNFTYEKVTGALETIMIKYGAEKLLGLLKGAAKDVIDKFTDREERRSQHYYSHQQKRHSGKNKGKSNNNNNNNSNNVGQDSTEQGTSAPSRTSSTTAQSSRHDPDQERIYRENIEAMHRLNGGTFSRTEAGAEDGSPTPTQSTTRQTTGPDPNASLSENFGLGLSVDDSAQSDVEQPRPAAAPSQSDALPPRRPVGKRRGVPGSEVAGDQPPAYSTRSKRSKK